MRTNTLRRKNTYETPLQAIKGGLIRTSEMEHLVHIAWNFAYNSLWNTIKFSSKEIEASKQQILEYLSLAKNPRKAFSSFCQRVLLARHYINAAKGRHLPLPSVWLDKENTLGFAGTKQWFIHIKQIRESLPEYKSEIKALAEAVLEFSEEPTRKNYEYWRGYFIDKGCPGLLNLFQTTAIHQLYN